MAKVVYRYGSMNSSKSASMIMSIHNYRSKGSDVLVFKPSVDTRSQQGYVESRVGIKTECIDIDTESNIISYIVQAVKDGRKLSCIFVDECQFLTEKQAYQLVAIADTFDIPVLVYGLRTDFRGLLFPASSVLMANADRIEEVKSICHAEGCNKKATHNQRLVNGRPVYKGEAVSVEGVSEEITYISKCRNCFYEDMKGGK